MALDVTALYDVRTGVGRMVQEVLPHLADDRRVDVRAYAVTFRGAGELGDLVPAGITPAGRRPMAARPLRALWRRSDLGRIERWTGPVDVVHGPNFVVPPARAAQVLTIHDLTFHHHPELCTSDVLQYPALIRRALRRGAWVHTVSEFVRGEVVALLGADPAKVVTVPLGVVAATSADAHRGRELAGGGRYVLALGTVEPRKRLPELVRAFDELAADHGDLRLVLAGPDGWGSDALAAAMAAARHRDRVVRLGFVDEATRGDLLAGASAVAVPSRYEGFGLSAAEALRAGVPVVASAAGSHPEVIGDAGVLVPLDHEGLVDGLRQVLEDDGLAAELRRRGPRQVAPLSWSATAAGLVDLWRRAAGR